MGPERYRLIASIVQKGINRASKISTVRKSGWLFRSYAKLWLQTDDPDTQCEHSEF